MMNMMRCIHLRLWSCQQLLRCCANYTSSSVASQAKQRLIQNNDLERPRRHEKVPAAILRSLRSNILLKEAYRKTVYHRQLVSFLDSGPSKKIPIHGSNEELKEMLKQAQPKELIEILKTVTSTRNATEAHTLCIQVVQSREKEFSTDELLYIADIHYVSGLDLTTYCNWLFHVLVSQAGRPAPNLHQAVQLLFLVGLRRNAPVTLLHQLEQILAEGHKELSTEELGLICNGFYACNRSLSNMDLLEGLWKALLRDGDRLQLSLVANILKSLRHADYGIPAHFLQLANILSERRDISSSQSMAPLAAVATAYSSARIRSEQLFKTLASGMVNCIEKNVNIRLKDLARFTLTCSNLQITPPKVIVKTLVDTLHKDKLCWSRYPEVSTEGVLALVSLEEYPRNIINRLLAPANIKAKTSRLLEQRMQHIYVDTAVSIACPQYTGYRLHQSVCTADWFQKEGSALAALRGLKVRKREALAWLWLAVAELAGGMQYVVCHAILPFTKLPDLEFRLDDDLQFIPLRSTSDVQADWELLQPLCEPVPGQQQAGSASVVSRLVLDPSDSFHLEIQHLSPLEKVFPETRVSIKVMGFNQYLRNAPLLLGMHEREIQLLRLAGYHVIIIPPNLAQKIKSSSRKEIKQIVQDSIIRLQS